MKKKILKIASWALLCMGMAVLLTGCLDSLKNISNSNANVNQNKAVSEEDLFAEETKVLATKDAFGEDLSGVERYPGSIRTYYAKDQYETSVLYETTDTEQQVREYFKSLLEGDGWTQTGIATDYIDFEKGDENNPEILTVYLTVYEDEGILEYELVYSPPLTEEELAAEESEE